MAQIGNPTSLTPQGFREVTDDSRLVVLYPQTGYRDSYLSKYLHEPDSGFFYYALQTPDRNLRQFLHDLVEELDALSNHFGSHTRQALSAKANAVDLATALGQDLDTLAAEPFTLLLDQFDRLPEKDETRRFMDALVKHVPAHCQILLNARPETYLPWNDLVTSGRAAVIGADFVTTSPVSTLEMDANGPPLIEVFAFGSGHVLVNGRPILQWDGVLPWHWFHFAIDRVPVTRDAIFDAFWPTLSVKEATNVFHVTKRKVNEKLGVDLTTYATGVYTLNEAVRVYYDVAEFEKAVAAAREAGIDERQRLCQRARALYRTPFLHRLEMTWADQRRAALAATYAEVLQGC